MATSLSIAYDVSLTLGVVLLGIGFFRRVTLLRRILQVIVWWRPRRTADSGRDRRSHLARAGGWSVFGIFWFLHVPEYAYQDDALNALGAAVALPIFLFVAYHEWLSYKWREEYEPLRFACGAAFFASAVYFAFARIPALAAVLVQVTADQTATLLNWMGYPFVAGSPDCGGAPLSSCGSGEAVTVGLYRVPVQPGQLPVVNIVIACAALQAFAVAASLMLTTRDPWKRKAIALAIVLPVTWVMNLVRNAVIIYFFGVRGDPFELVHNWYGKTLSLAVLLVLVFVAFKLLPELYLNINGLFELPWRKGPRHDYLRFVGRLSRKKAEPPTTPATGGATSRSGTGGAEQTPPSSP